MPGKKSDPDNHLEARRAARQTSAQPGRAGYPPRMMVERRRCGTPFSTPDTKGRNLTLITTPRPGGPPAKRQPSPEGLGYAPRMMVERRRCGTPFSTPDAREEIRA